MTYYLLLTTYYLLLTTYYLLLTTYYLLLTTYYLLLTTYYLLLTTYYLLLTTYYLLLTTYYLLLLRFIGVACRPHCHHPSSGGLCLHWDRLHRRERLQLAIALHRLLVGCLHWVGDS